MPASQMYRASGSEYREQMRSVLPHFSSRSLLEPQVLTPMTYRVEQEQVTSSAAMRNVALNGSCPACRILFDAGASEPRNEIVADADGPTAPIVTTAAPRYVENRWRERPEALQWIQSIPVLPQRYTSKRSHACMHSTQVLIHPIH